MRSACSVRTPRTASLSGNLDGLENVAWDSPPRGGAATTQSRACASVQHGEGASLRTRGGRADEPKDARSRTFPAAAVGDQATLIRTEPELDELIDGDET